MYVECESVRVCVECVESPWFRLSCSSGQQAGCARREDSDHLFPPLSLLPWARPSHALPLTTAVTSSLSFLLSPTSLPGIL